MANLRSGDYGSYYGSFFDESEPLSTSEMQVNATYLLNALLPKGWTINAVAALCGNMQAESTINPGRWQSDSVGWASGGYGLVQWTPTTKYIDWCSEQGYSDPSEMDNNIARILYELANGGQWYATSSYDMSFSEFSRSSLDSGTLAKAFLLNYERPKDQSSSVQSFRASLAESWFTYLNSGDVPDIPDPDEPDEPGTSGASRRKKASFKFLLFNTKNRRLKRG